MSSPFILAPGEQHPGAPPLAWHSPLIRIASGRTDGLMALREVTLPPRTPGPHLHVHSGEDEMFFSRDQNHYRANETVDTSSLLVPAGKQAVAMLFIV